MSYSSPVLIRAPCNLGLRPLRPGHEPGTWRAPQVLTKTGLVNALTPRQIVDLPRPIYDPEPQDGTRLRNGRTLRSFNLMLADAVASAAAAAEFPVIVGGDCSILLGALAGVSRRAPISLVHIDGHSDFRHPGNYDASRTLGAVAGMDLALATGRGEGLMTDWPGAPSPLVPDEQVVQIGERQGHDLDFAWPDVNDTAITRIDVFTARQIGAQAILEKTRATLDRKRDWPFWLHFDVDVLDKLDMPAVDSPGSPGIEPAELVVVLRGLLRLERCAGITVTIFDPDLDPTGRYASLVVSILKASFSD